MILVPASVQAVGQPDVHLVVLVRHEARHVRYERLVERQAQLPPHRRSVYSAPVRPQVYSAADNVRGLLEVAYLPESRKTGKGIAQYVRSVAGDEGRAHAPV